MGIRFLCPNGHNLHVKADLAGKRGICPECGAKVTIPSVSLIPEDVSGPQQQVATARGAAATPPLPPQQERIVPADKLAPSSPAASSPPRGPVAPPQKGPPPGPVAPVSPQIVVSEGASSPGEEATSRSKGSSRAARKKRRDQLVTTLLVLVTLILGVLLAMVLLWK